ncbi:MAG: N-acetylmuramic acid 6-phosphate etherase [Chloroflexota bacterium]|nr:N-acetylmuramic acid 6-phosphate etherase [Chloroflexota bacterium]PLS79801.1 MAG: N-acetylmuramic acid 6-phosphate etherase [Chloroflexota bacterium]
MSVTESINPATAVIDTLSTRDIVAAIAAEDARVAGAVAAQGEAIALLADQVVACMQRGGRLIYVGAGTSGRLGVLDAAECPPTFGVPPTLVVARIAGGPRALTDSIEAVEDHAALGEHDVAELNVGPDDVVLGIAASGRTPYVLGAIAEARRRGAFVAGLACTHPSPLAAAVDLMIAPIVGPEVIAGSTRLKAGTAQKMVLNTLSTTVMIRLGKTFGNLMVDVQPTNEKLRRRAAGIVTTATGVSQEEAQRLLRASDYEAKTAIVMALAGVGVDEARRRLQHNEGHVRRALGALPNG